MPGQSTPVKERRTGSREVVKKLTAERREMLALYCRVAGLDPFSENSSSGNSNGTKNRDNGQMQALLQEFCQILVDYVAAGHFSLYERIINGQERRKEVAELAEKLYPKIAETTEIALEFNDKYDCEDHCQIDGDFEKDLSRLGESLATRIELEDQLLKVLR